MKNIIRFLLVFLVAILFFMKCTKIEYLTNINFSNKLLLRGFTLKKEKDKVVLTLYMKVIGKIEERVKYDMFGIILRPLDINTIPLENKVARDNKQIAIGFRVHNIENWKINTIHPLIYEFELVKHNLYNSLLPGKYNLYLYSNRYGFKKGEIKHFYIYEDNGSTKTVLKFINLISIE